MDERLKQAYDLLKQGEHLPALTLIMQVIQQDRRNADAWYLLAAARQDVDGKRVAVNHALQINPNHQAAQRLSQRLNTVSGTQTAAPPPTAQGIMPQDSGIVPLRSKQGALTSLLPKTDAPTAPPQMIESTEGDPWRDQWSNPTSTILGLLMLIAAMTFPFARYLKAHEQIPGLILLILVIGFGIAGVRWVMGKTIDGRAILPITILTGIMWFLMVADLSGDDDPENARHGVLFLTFLYGVIILGWTTDKMPFGPQLKKAVLSKFGTRVSLMGPIQLGETRRSNIQIVEPLRNHVYFYHGQAGDEIMPMPYEEENLTPMLFADVYAWITVFGLWGKLFQLTNQTLNKSRLPYTGIYVILVYPRNPEIDTDPYSEHTTGLDYRDYRLEMQGTRHGSGETVTSLSSFYFALKLFLGEKFTRQYDPGYYIEKEIDKHL